MKKVVGYILSWILYWLGDLIGRLMLWFDWWWMYPTYNRIMLWSGKVQDWAENIKPWSKIK